MTNEAQKLRELAAWYREFAERAGASWIWEARLRRASELEREADRLQASMAETLLSPDSSDRKRG
jgi:hypothetical protein